MESLVEFFIDLFGGISKDVIIFVISLMPISELRGGLLAASLLDVEYVRAAIICVVGNVLPIPIVLLFLKMVLDIFSKWKVTKKIVDWLQKKVDNKREQIDKYGYLGLALFVGIPLPGTGAWTGALLAVMLGMNRKKSFIFILLGVLMAAIIMSILSYGILGNLL
ncbi:MAG: small multi-drug export protein [Bacilli bacterium]|nr:small multi-drug export protein [Bacilli bacterium]